MHAISLAARKHPDALLLVGTRKIKTRNISPRIHLALAELNNVQAVRDFIENSFVSVQRIARLVNVAELDGFADFESSRVCRVLSGNQTEKRRFARAVRTDNADDSAARQAEFEIFKQQFIGVTF